MSDTRPTDLAAVSGLAAEQGRFAWTPSPLVLVVSGPSGAGKDSVIRRLQERHGSLHFVVTAASRPPREGEVDGRDYHFFSANEFQRRIRQGEFLEQSEVYGEYKGVPKWEITRALDSGEDAVLRVDVQGARKLRPLLPDAVFVFIMAESEDEHLRRLLHRGSHREGSFEARRAQLWKEISHLPEFDYLVINHRDQLDQAAEDMLAIIRAEKCRVRRQPRP